MTKKYQNYLMRRQFGQHFLKNDLIIKNIIAKINPKIGEIMVEIGPGLGALTKQIIKYLDHLTVIELDRNLATYLRLHNSINSKLTIYQQDVMNINFSQLSKKFGKSLRIFGNIPYNISVPLIFNLINYINAIEDIHFMLQKEVANRLVAKPNSKNYGRLSIITQYYFRINIVLELIPPSVFIPSPKVDSAMVHLVPHAIMPHLAKEPHILEYITMKAFNQRRKMISNSLSNILNIKAFDVLKINSKLRAENVSIAQYCQIANYISNNIQLKKI